MWVTVIILLILYILFNKNKLRRTDFKKEDKRLDSKSLNYYKPISKEDIKVTKQDNSFIRPKIEKSTSKNQLDTYTNVPLESKESIRPWSKTSQEANITYSDVVQTYKSLSDINKCKAYLNLVDTSINKYGSQHDKISYLIYTVLQNANNRSSLNANNNQIKSIKHFQETSDLIVDKLNYPNNELLTKSYSDKDTDIQILKEDELQQQDKDKTINRSEILNDKDDVKSPKEKIIINKQSINKQKSNIEDSGIIDIEDKPYSLLTRNNVFSKFDKVPSWEHSYIYSASYLDNARPRQKKFYYYFKEQFCNHNFIDLEGNTNYAFILLFDFIDRFKNDKNISYLLSNLSYLAKNYPTTQKYCLTNIEFNIINELKDEDIYIQLKQHRILAETLQPIGYKLLSKCDLSFKEVQLLNSKENPLKNFIDCETIKNANEYFSLVKKYSHIQDFYYTTGYGYQYISIIDLNIHEFTLLNWCWSNLKFIANTTNEKKLKNLHELLQKYPQILDDPILKKRFSHTYFVDLNPSFIEFKLLYLSSIQQNSFATTKDHTQMISEVFIRTIREFNMKANSKENLIESLLYILSDKIVKHKFNYKRGTQSYLAAFDKEYIILITTLTKLAENCVRELCKHSRKLSITLKIDSELIKEQFITELSYPFQTIAQEVALELVPHSIGKKESMTKPTYLIDIYNSNITDPTVFYDKILKLRLENPVNPLFINTLFRASKEISKKNKSISLYLYAHYVFHNITSGNQDYLKMSKSMLTSLFKTSKQHESFKQIIRNLLKTKRLDITLKELSAFYIEKRKYITINNYEVSNQKRDFLETVSLLNNYLEENEHETIICKHNICFKQNKDTKIKNIYLDNLNLGPNDIFLLGYFIKNNFKLSSEQLKEYALSVNAFPDNLVDTLNERCYEYLNDLLIDIDGNDLIIYEDNYKLILQ